MQESLRAAARTNARFRRSAYALLVLALALLAGACGGSSKSDSNTKTGTEPTASTANGSTTTASTTTTAASVDGKTVFSNNCSICHGATGEGGNGGPPINQGKTKELVVHQVTNGGGGMPAFGNQLSSEEITAVADHVVSLQQ